MKSNEFQPLVDAQLERCLNTLGIKAEEYSGEEDDRLHNFKQAAVIQGITLREALGGFMAKHTVSIYDMIRSEVPYSMDVWNEKITDHINYLLLLDAVIKEEDLERKGLNDVPSELTSPPKVMVRPKSEPLPDVNEIDKTLGMSNGVPDTAESLTS